MNNLLESLFLCYDTSNDNSEIRESKRITIFARRNNRTVVK